MSLVSNIVDRITRRFADFDESKVSRDDDGQFAPKGGSDAGVTELEAELEAALEDMGMVEGEDYNMTDSLREALLAAPEGTTPTIAAEQWGSALDVVGQLAHEDLDMAEEMFDDLEGMLLNLGVTGRPGARVKDAGFALQEEVIPFLHEGSFQEAANIIANIRKSLGV